MDSNKFSGQEILAAGGVILSLLFLVSKFNRTQMLSRRLQFKSLSPAIESTPLSTSTTPIWPGSFKSPRKISRSSMTRKSSDILDGRTLGPCWGRASSGSGNWAYCLMRSGQLLRRHCVKTQVTQIRKPKINCLMHFSCRHL